MKTAASKKNNTREHPFSQEQLDRILSSPYFIEKDERALEMVINSNGDEFVKALEEKRNTNS